jgi:hypothetical protein
LIALPNEVLISSLSRPGSAARNSKKGVRADSSPDSIPQAFPPRLPLTLAPVPGKIRQNQPESLTGKQPVLKSIT